MRIMFWLGAKPNGTPHTFTVGPEFARNAGLLMAALVSVSVFVATAVGMPAEVCRLKEEVSELKLERQTVRAKLETMSEDLRDIKNLLMRRQGLP